MAAKPALDEAPPPRPAGKLGANSPCWCNSGRKYKKCHRPADEEAERAARAAAMRAADGRLCPHAGEPCYVYAGLADSVASMLPVGLNVELCPVDREVLDYALASVGHIQGGAMIRAKTKVQVWTTTACAALSVTPLELAAHLTLLGYRGSDLAVLDAGSAAVAQRLGRRLAQPGTEAPGGDSPEPLKDRRPSGFRLTRNVSPEQAIRALERDGWRHDRTSGDHAILEKDGSATRIVLPLARHHLSNGRLLGLIREANLTEQRFAALLQG